jgi:predicted phosphodiesterase
MVMKTVVIGDIHGRSIWKSIVQKENPDKVIFVGDYFDSFDIPGVDQIHNFKEIIEYKETSFTNEGTDLQHKTKVILLIGNHDYHYFPDVGYNGTSGYQIGIAPNIIQVLQENRHHLQMAYQMGEFVFTHAGISSQFMDDVFGIDGWKVDTLAEDLNELFKYKPKALEFSGKNPYGDDPEQGPLWIRPKSLMKINRDTLRKKIIQVVGHTAVHKIDKESKTTGGRYYFIDTLDTSGEYMIIENNQITFNTVN